VRNNVRFLRRGVGSRHQDGGLNEEGMVEFHAPIDTPLNLIAPYLATIEDMPSVQNVLTERGEAHLAVKVYFRQFDSSSRTARQEIEQMVGTLEREYETVGR
jgi:hypothetical protein